MGDLDFFSQLPVTAKLAVIWIAVCVSALLTLLICAPKRNAFFLRWNQEARVLALIFPPTLLIIWPIVLFGIFLESRGISPDDPDFLDD